MVKHRSAKRATKRSAKRAAKRGAYKSKKTHRKMKLSRKRMQRGGGWKEDMAAKLEAGTSRLQEGVTGLKNKASEFKETNFDTAAAALKEGAANIVSKIPGWSSRSSTLMPDDGGGVIPAPIQSTDEENKAALIADLKAANIKTVNKYNDEVIVSNAARLKVTSNRTNGISNKAAEDELKTLQTATSKAYQVAFDAAKAAVAGGVPESEVVFPRV